MPRSTAIPLRLHPIQLRSVELHEVAVRRKPQEQIDPANGGATLEARVRSSAPERNEQGGSLTTTVTVHARWPGAPAPYDLRFTLVGNFGFGPDIEDQVLRQFADSSSFTLLWPFAREFALDIQRRMGVPIVPLPTVVLPNVRELIHLSHSQST
jgi:preprotein translocase subunit SecB